MQEMIECIVVVALIFSGNSTYSHNSLIIVCNCFILWNYVCFVHLEFPRKQDFAKIVIKQFISFCRYSGVVSFVLKGNCGGSTAYPKVGKRDNFHYLV